MSVPLRVPVSTAPVVPTTPGECTSDLTGRAAANHRVGKNGTVVDVAGVILTGGRSRRMGRPKATVLGPDGVTWAVRGARVLAAVAEPVVEVGPGHCEAEVDGVIDG